MKAESCRIELTDANVTTLPAPVSGRVQYTDTHKKAPSGFGLRVTDKGARSYSVQFRIAEGPRAGSLVRVKVGEPGKITLAKARKKAEALAANRVDPKPAAEVVEVEPAAPETYRQAVQDYIKRHQKGREQNVTAREVERSLLRVGGARKGVRNGAEVIGWPEWVDRPLSHLTPKGIAGALEVIRDGDEDKGFKGAPYMANRTYAHLRTFFGWCCEPGVDKLTASPMAGVRKPWNGEESRERHYSDAELSAIWAAADRMDVYLGGIVRLLILTGKRKGAAAAMRRDQIAADGFWTPPQDRRRKRGNKRQHPIPLPGLALEVINAMPKIEGSQHVFPGKFEGQPLTIGWKEQQEVQEHSGIADFQFHAIRHTVETGLGAIGVQPHLRDLLLDHAPARGAGAGYDHHSYREEMAEVLEAWANKVTWPKQAPRPEDVPPKDRPRPLWQSYRMGVEAYSVSLEPKQEQKVRRRPRRAA